MTTDITLQATLDEQSRWSVQRQLDLKLASVAWFIQAVRVELSHAEGRSGRVMYRCDMDATLGNALVLNLTAESALVASCVADAAARLRREIGRELRFGAARRMSSVNVSQVRRTELPELTR